jgi:Flp pilus assembly protein TadB
MIAMALVGAAIGTTLFALGWQLFPPKTSALVQLGRFDARDRAVTAAAGGGGDRTLRAGLSARAGRWLAGELSRRGFAYTTLRQDLALTGRTFESALGRKVMAFVAGFLVVSGTAMTVQVASGLALPAGAWVLVALVVGGGFFFIPDIEARQEAAARRRDFRRALGAYLDLVALEMAGSAAPAEALPNAARVGAGWPMALLRDTLWRATMSGQDQWEALTDLGARIGVGELRDLGTLVRLVGRDGARVRATLTARAATMRRQELAHAEGEAGQRDQSMLLAQILIGFGFIAFITYPAIVAVMAF